MGISTALNIAASGLRATQTQSDLVARNIANALSEGYTRKSAELQTRSGSVVVSSVNREVDQLLDRLDRTNISDVARSQTIAEGLGTYTDLLGQPEDQTSPVAGLTNLYNALLTLSGSPLASASQMTVLQSASALTEQINSLSSTATSLGREIELNIRYDVSDVNDRLSQIAQINNRLSQTGGTGVEGAELKDEMGRLLNEIAGYMEIQTVNNSDGSVNLYTGGGTELIAGKRATTLVYDGVNQTLKAGQIEITPGRAGVRGFEGGSLAGLFTLSNSAVPEIQKELDSLAHMLITRFTAADGSLGTGQAGLFIDTNQGVGAGQLAGLAGRIGVNPALDPTQGGDEALLVTGLGATNTVAKGSNSLIEAMMGAIDLRTQDATPLGTGVSLSDYAASMVSQQQQLRVQAENAAKQAEISGATISASRQNLQGVNVEDELQQLLVIEQSFAANAKVLTSLQSMLDSLMAAV